MTKTIIITLIILVSLTIAGFFIDKAIKNSKTKKASEDATNPYAGLTKEQKETLAQQLADVNEITPEEIKSK